MVVRRSKKIRKQRGSRLHGYGRVSGGHRASGTRGGVGLTTGRFKHEKIKHLKAGTVGVRSKMIIGRGFTRKLITKPVNTWNVHNLNNYIATKAAHGETVSELNLKEMGINKLLGKGTLRYAVKVTVEQATEKAVEKVKAAGGSVTLLSAEKSE